MTLTLVVLTAEAGARRGMQEVTAGQGALQIYSPCWRASAYFFACERRASGCDCVGVFESKP